MQYDDSINGTILANANRVNKIYQNPIFLKASGRTDTTDQQLAKRASPHNRVPSVGQPFISASALPVNGRIAKDH